MFLIWESWRNIGYHRVTIALRVYFLLCSIKRIRFVKRFILNNIRDKYYALIGFNYIKYIKMRAGLPVF